MLINLHKIPTRHYLSNQSTVYRMNYYAPRLATGTDDILLVCLRQDEVYTTLEPPLSSD
jgi:hypothetical protein